MKARWMTAFVAALALGTPRLLLASDVSYDKQLQQQRTDGTNTTGGTGREGMQRQGRRAAEGKGTHRMNCSCPCGSSTSGAPRS